MMYNKVVENFRSAGFLVVERDDRVLIQKSGFWGTVFAEVENKSGVARLVKVEGCAKLITWLLLPFPLLYWLLNKGGRVGEVRFLVGG